MPIFTVDAFTDQLFRGNPAAVCPLRDWLPDELLGSIAAENNLSETAYIVPRDGGYGLRWFTPTVEVDLCGHATLAAGHVVLRELSHPPTEEVVFETRSGELRVRIAPPGYEIDLPATPPVAAPSPDPQIATAIGTTPQETLGGPHHVAVLTHEAAVRAVRPDFALVAELGGGGLIVTAPGDDVDFVSRFFAPHHGIPEDPVTGSAHCTLGPYWAERLGKTHLRARQVSPRGGALECQVGPASVSLRGQCRSYLRGTIELP
ncbi:MAG: PhzF family phenazine biosynthesis protein [Myxococcales bacterium FL481]|nr:MAG: PhzF family phenazine biosynthesis protein [Myxococcales bacterium FL481]